MTRTPRTDQYTIENVTQCHQYAVSGLSLHLQAQSFHFPRILFPQILTAVVRVRIAR